MNNKLLAKFRASLGGTSRDDILERGTRVANQLHEFDLPLPYTYIKRKEQKFVKLERIKLELQPGGYFIVIPPPDGYWSRYRYGHREKIDSKDVKTEEIKRLVNNGEKRLAKVESLFDKVTSLHSTDVAEIIFGGTKDKHGHYSKCDIARTLQQRKLSELADLPPKVINDLVERLYFQMKVKDCLFTFDFSNQKQRSYVSMNLSSHGIQPILKFLVEFQEIKQELEQRIEKLLVKEV